MSEDLVPEESPERPFWLVPKDCLPPRGYIKFDIGPPYAPHEFSIAIHESWANGLHSTYRWRNRWQTLNPGDEPMFDQDGNLIYEVKLIQKQAKLDDLNRENFLALTKLS